MRDAAPGFGAAWTVTEAARFLDPPISRETLHLLIRALAIPEAGHARRDPVTHRPVPVYPVAELMRLHGAALPWLVRSPIPETVDDGVYPC